MIENVIGALLRTQTVSLKRKASGAAVEIGALGLFGFASIFASIGAFLWLSQLVQPWLAAFIVAGALSLLAAVGMLIGNAIMKKRDYRTSREIERGLAELGPIAQALDAVHSDPSASAGKKPSMVVLALAAGVVLGQALRR